MAHVHDVLNTPNSRVHDVLNTLRVHDVLNTNTYQVNFAHLLSKMKDTVVLLLRGLQVENILSSLWYIMLHTVEPIRPGRKYPRNKTGRVRRFAMAYKPLR